MGYERYGLGGSRLYAQLLLSAQRSSIIGRSSAAPYHHAVPRVPGFNLVITTGSQVRLYGIPGCHVGLTSMEQVELDISGPCRRITCNFITVEQSRISSIINPRQVQYDAALCEPWEGCKTPGCYACSHARDAVT